MTRHCEITADIYLFQLSTYSWFKNKLVQLFICVLWHKLTCSQKKPTRTLTFQTKTCFFKLWIEKEFIALSAGAVEYTDCISAEGWNTPNEGPGYDTKQSNGEASLMLEL